MEDLCKNEYCLFITLD